MQKKEIIKNFYDFLNNGHVIETYVSCLHYDLIDEYGDNKKTQKLEDKIFDTINNLFAKNI